MDKRRRTAASCTTKKVLHLDQGVTSQKLYEGIMAARIPTVDTSVVPEAEPMLDSAWEMTDGPTMAFERLAASMSRIIAGCKKRCTVERLKGAKQACVDLISFATRSSSGEIPVDRLSDACHIFLQHRERPSEHGGCAAADAASTDDSDRDFMPGFSARGRDDGPAVDPVDPASDDFMFNAGAILFTQFYRERTREIRLAFVCGYRDVLARAIAWATGNRSASNTVRTEALVGMLAWLVSRAPRSESSHSPARQHVSPHRLAACGRGVRGGTSTEAGAATSSPSSAGSVGLSGDVTTGVGVDDWSIGCKRREHFDDLNSEMVALSVEPSDERELIRSAKRHRVFGSGGGGGGGSSSSSAV